MKKFCFLTIVILLIFSGCTKEAQTEQVDLNTVNKTITQMLDDYLEAWNAKNLDALAAMMAEDGQFYGSDPEEIMDKAALLDMYSSFFSDTTGDYSYDTLLRKIKPSISGKSATAMERIVFEGWSPKIPMCQTFHFVDTGDKWEIDFIVWGFIIKNDEVVMLNEALE